MEAKHSSFSTSSTQQHTTPLPSDLPPIQAHPLSYELKATAQYARASLLQLPHGPLETPVFMPVGTQGTIKGLTAKQVDDIGFQIILGNTYHLGLRPGTELIRDMGGLHNFMKWPRNLLTDSGGFQMVSLSNLAEFTEQGVLFQSPVDGTTLMLSPEKSIELQNNIGADIIMQLDDVISSVSVDHERFVLATHRSVR